MLFVNSVVKGRKQSAQVVLMWNRHPLRRSAPAKPISGSCPRTSVILCFAPHLTFVSFSTTSLFSRAQGLITSPANMAGIVEQLDSTIASVFSGWNIYSSTLTFGIFGFIAWIIFDTQDADTHPLLLARQAVASYVRQPGESAIYRSPETPHGCMVFCSEHVLSIRG